MDICGCGCACGLMEYCSNGADCECECHETDTLTCYEIVTCCKQIVPHMRTADVAGMSRNAFFGWFNHESEFTASQKEKISDLFNMRSRMRKNNATDFVVPSNIAQLVGNVQPVHVKYLQAKHDPLGTHHVVLQRAGGGNKPTAKPTAATKKAAAKKPAVSKKPIAKKAAAKKKAPAAKKKAPAKKACKKACVDK